jgi:Zn2+/Cd2+-exporting ATPase
MNARMDLDLILPEPEHACDQCYQRLRDLLEAKLGIDSTHMIERTGSDATQLCIHFDSTLLSLQQLRQFARQAGADLQEQYGHLVVDIAQQTARRARRLSSDLSDRAGVLEAVVSPVGIVRLEFDRAMVSEAELRATVESTTGRAKTDEKGHVHVSPFGDKIELVFVSLCGLTLLLGWLLPRMTDLPGWLPLTLLIGAYVFGGWFTLREAIANLRASRFEIDSLMLVAAAGAAVLGEWAEGGLLLFLFSLGHALEHYAMGRARHAIEALAELAPDVAIVRSQGRDFAIPVEELEIGDTVIVRPNDRLPADGFVIKGMSAVNQAPVTGESMPVDKRPVDDRDRALQQPHLVDAEHRVFAGTINGSGALAVIVTQRAAQSTLSRVVEMVAEAEAQRSPTQRFTDRFERIFVPVTLALVVVVFGAGLVIDESFSSSFYRAMALLVAASPCALAIATPSAVLSGIARAARSGVLIKGGAPLENLGILQAIAFDKTGTLTKGKPQLTDVWSASGASKVDLLTVAIAVESLSDHPLASAVVRDGKLVTGDSLIPQAENLKSITGRGVQAKVDGANVFVGNDKLFSELSETGLPADIRMVVDQLEDMARTTVIVKRDDQFLGVLGLMDTPRESALAVLERLRALGVRQLIMISGDNQRAANAIAQMVGMTAARGDLMPDEKVEEIAKLRRQYGKVAMVGDGVNDAPAMANATVGIAMGAAGSDVALETADVALMADDLTRLPFAVGLSRATLRIIRQNLWVSMGVVAFLIPATISGLGIGLAILFHEGATLVVVVNALRLLVYRDCTPKPALKGGQ